MTYMTKSAVDDYMRSRWPYIAEATKSIYTRAASALVTHLGDRCISEISPADIHELAIPNGVRAQVMNLAQSSANWALRHGYVTATRDWRRCSITLKGEWEAWTQADLDAAAKSISGRRASSMLVQDLHDLVVHDVVMFAAYTGMRRKDIFSLTQKNLYTDPAGRVFLTYTQSKTGWEIDMPLSDRVKDLKMVRRILQGGEPFCGVVTLENFYHKYRGYCRRVGVDKPFHGLRKFCASRLAEAGCSMPELMAITGHESPNTAMKYIRSASKRKLTTNAISKMDAL